MSQNPKHAETTNVLTLEDSIPLGYLRLIDCHYLYYYNHV